MNTHIRTSPGKHATSAWERPLHGPDTTLTNRSFEDIELWWVLIDRVIEVALANSWTKADVSRRLNMPEGTFSQWFSGKYAGRFDSTNTQVKQWLDAIASAASISASIPSSPSFIRMRGTNEIIENLIWAQIATDMVVITFGAGMGKTATCRHVRDTRPNVHLVTMSPHTRTLHGMLTELAAALEVTVHNPAKIARAIGQRLQKSGGDTLLIIDEAQNLLDDSINQLRHFVDNYQCGVALVGNEEIYTRFSKKADGPSYAQIKSRIGKQLKRVRPTVEDLQAYIAAWNVTDPAMIKFLTGIGLKGGAFRQIDKTMKLAIMSAMGSEKPLSLSDIEAAWKNRDVEGLA